MGRWSESRRSYLRDESNGGATVAASEAGDDATAAALRFLRSMGVRERKRERVRARVGEQQRRGIFHPSLA